MNIKPYCYDLKIRIAALELKMLSTSCLISHYSFSLVFPKTTTSLQALLLSSNPKRLEGTHLYYLYVGLAAQCSIWCIVRS